MDGDQTEDTPGNIVIAEVSPTRPQAAVITTEPPAAVITTEPPAAVITTEPPAAVITTRGCNTVVYDDGKYIINTDGGDWARDGWCTVLDDQTGANNDAYTVSVDMYANTDVVNFLGIAYNVQDMNNFDIIYYRPQSIDRCFQSGFVLNGASTWGVKGECPTQPEFKQWFNAKVVVKSNNNNADLYLNGELVTNNQPMRFAKKAKAGVIVANGDDNVAHFKNLEIN